MSYTVSGVVPKTFWAACQEAAAKTGADAFLLAAIGGHETYFGTRGAGLEGYALGYGVYSETNLDPRFKGLGNQLYYAGMQIANFMRGRETTEDTIYDFMVNSWKPGDKNWYLGVWGMYQEIKVAAPVNIPTNAPVNVQEDPDVNLIVWVRESKAEGVRKQIVDMGFLCEQFPIAKR